MLAAAEQQAQRDSNERRDISIKCAPCWTPLTVCSVHVRIVKATHMQLVVR